MQFKIFATPERGIAILTVYLVLLFASLGQTPALVRWIAGYGFLKTGVSLLMVFFAALILGLSFSKGRLKKPSAWVTIIGAVLLYLVVAYLTPDTPAERVHLLTYGILSFILFSVGRFRWNGGRLYATSGIITAAIGTLDEVVQYFLPNRFFDLKDIIINALGGLTALAIIRFVLGDKGKRCEV